MQYLYDCHLWIKGNSLTYFLAYLFADFTGQIVEYFMNIAGWCEGMKHCRGILLFGPPGTGKTLMARQIGNMLNAREPKIVNGPQVLDKYVGESEANIRKLFAEAEEEEKRVCETFSCNCGNNSTG